MVVIGNGFALLYGDTGSNPVLTANNKIMKKTYSQMQFELSQLLILFNSKYGNIESSLEEKIKMQTRILELRNQMKEIK